MSYRSLLRHRCTILRLSMTADSGSPVSQWVSVAENIKCYLDLNFIRKGKDPVWQPESGRPVDRTGVLFLLGDAPIKSGDSISMTFGPPGTFQIEGAIDEAWQPSARHHIEVGVKEVATQLARGNYYQEFNNG